jgi:hypothetical protein
MKEQKAMNYLYLIFAVFFLIYFCDLRYFKLTATERTPHAAAYPWLKDWFYAREACNHWGAFISPSTLPSNF